jgi:hypothetical protein
MIWVAVIAFLDLAVAVRELALGVAGDALAVRDVAELEDVLMAAGADTGETAVAAVAGPSARASPGTTPVVAATIATAARALPDASKTRWR